MIPSCPELALRAINHSEHHVPQSRKPALWATREIQAQGRVVVQAPGWSAGTTDGS
jgi:hypothetical protein